MEQHNQSQFGSAVAKGEQLPELIKQVTQEALRSFSDNKVDLACLFVTSAFKDQYFEVVDLLRKEIDIDVLMGCSALNVIGTNEELDSDSAISLFLAKLPDVKKIPFWIKPSDLEQMKDKEKCQAFFGVSSEENPTFFILPDPFSFNMNLFIESIEHAFPGAPMVGGMASAATEPGENVLFWSEGICSEGAVGVVLSGNVKVKPLVSQGCRPFGEPAVITECQENVIHNLAGKTALQFLEENYRKASARDQVLARQALFIGSLVDELKQNPETGDFVIRNVVGLDRNSGALSVSDYVNIGNTVQFHVRDSQSAHEDLETLCLDQKKEEVNSSKFTPPKAGLIFNCNGRGKHMFDEKNHDVTLLHEQLGDFPISGFFCAGEIGPIGDKNFLHGFTASIALFY